MLASNYSENLNINLHNNNNEQIGAVNTPSSSSSSLDYLYQAITLIEETKNNSISSMLEAKSNKQDDREAIYTNLEKQSVNSCNNPCCNCQNKTSSKLKRKHINDGPVRVIKQHREERKNERQNLSKFKKIKTFDVNYPVHSFNTNKPMIPSRLEKAKQLSRKELRLNISDPLTPISSSSMSPQSIKSVVSPSDSPFLNSQQPNNQSNAFNYYPVEIISNMFPFYYTPFSQNNNLTSFSQIPTGPAVSQTVSQPQQSLLNNDQNYLQNLISTIYSLANYQQLQQLQHINNPLVASTPSMLNTNNLILYSIQQQLQQNQQQQQRLNNMSNQPQAANKVTKSPSEPLVKSKLISYINETDIENKVNEHFRRSLGSKYLKISHKLNRNNNSIRASKHKLRNYDLDSNKNNEYDNNSCESATKIIENDLINENFDELNYVQEENEDTFIEYSNDETALVTNPLSPASTVSASDSYSVRNQTNEDEYDDEDIMENEFNQEDERDNDEQEEREQDDENTILTSAATNNSLPYSPVSSNSIAEVNY